MQYAASLSEHPLASHATGQVVGEVLEAVGSAPDLAMLFVSGDHIDAVPDIVATVREVLQPTALIGTTAVAVVGRDQEIEQTPAISLWAGWCGPVTPVRLVTEQVGQGWQLTGLPAGAVDGTLIALADPFSFPTDVLLRGIDGSLPNLAVVGGLASAANQAGGNRMVLNGDIHQSGAVGVVVERGAVRTVVSQGCRPIGEPFTITRAERNVIYELGGKSAIERMHDMMASLSDHDGELVRRGLHMGVVVNEQQLDFDRGDFIIRAVQGLDAQAGAVAIGDHAHVGSTVQFQVRDAATAHEDLTELLAQQERHESGLLFTCNGRGSHLFDQPHHDAEMFAHSVSNKALAGMFCAGEIGPIGGRNFLHGFTASAALFTR